MNEGTGCSPEVSSFSSLKKTKKKALAGVAQPQADAAAPAIAQAWPPLQTQPGVPTHSTALRCYLKGNILLISDKKKFFSISSYATFLEWYFNAWKLSESRISFPLSERRGKSFIAELAVSFFRNHKNFLKSNHKHPGQVNMQISL